MGKTKDIEIEKCVKCNHFDPRKEKADDLYNIVCGNCGFRMFVSVESDITFNGKELPLK